MKTNPFPLLLSITSEGEISWLLSTSRGKEEYTYLLDTAYLDQVIRLERRAPGKAFNLCKRLGRLLAKPEKGD